MDSDEDDISLTSSHDSEHGDDDEFEVEDILTVDDSDPKELKYLVKWKNYSTDRATLEPEENLPDDVMAIWLKKEQSIKAGKVEKYPIKSWRILVRDAQKEKEARHRRREAKRRRIANRRNANRQVDAVMVDSDSSSTEAIEEDDAPDPITKRRATGKPKPKQSIFGASLPVAAATSSSSFTLRPSTPATRTHPPPRTSSSRAPTALSKPQLPLPQLPARPQHRLSTARSSLTSKPPPATALASSSRLTHGPGKTVSTGNAPPKAPPRAHTIHVQAQPAPINARLPRPLHRKSASAIPASNAASVFAAPSRNMITHEMAGELRATKRPTAKKSKPVPGNVFVSGKVSKAKPSMADQFRDPSRVQEPGKHFSTFSRIRKAELRAREMTDTHVPFSSLSAVLRRSPTGARAEREESQLFVNSRPQSEDAIPKPEPGLEPELGLGPGSDIPRLPKKRKSVRFADEPTIADDPMITDTKESTCLRGTPDPMDISRDITKSVIMGALITEPVQLVFEAVLQDAAIPWVNAFCSTEIPTLNFSSICQAQHIQDRSQLIPLFMGAAQVLFGGPSKTKFDDVIAQLRRGDSALIASGLGPASGPQFAILLYPAQCKEWHNILGQPETARCEQNPLNYCILPSLDLVSLPALAVGDATSGTEIIELTKLYFGWNFNQILPQQESKLQKSPRIFYLLLPATAGTVYCTLGKWLFVNSADGAEIYTSRDPGGWNAFLKHHTGTVIIHHSCMRLLRHIPLLSEILAQRYSFWVIHDLQASSVPTAHQPLSLPFPEPRRLGMSQIFPLGGAILITPSFLLTEPTYTLDLLRWYQQLRNSEASRYAYSWAIVVAHNLPVYLLDLCSEQIKQRDALQSAMPNVEVRALEETRRRISPEFISQRYQVWKIVDELQASQLGGDETLSGLISAPNSIDANDEQSLVNWFGYWSLSNMRKYRKFYVVGTSEARQNGSRIFPIPNFGRRTVADPDKAFAREQAAASSALVLEPEMDIDESPEVHETRILSASSQFHSPEPLQEATSLNSPGSNAPPMASELFGSESALEFQDHLKKLNMKYGMGVAPFWRLYNRPISWDSDEMQDFFENNLFDRRDNYERYFDWWTHSYPFFGVSAPGRSSRAFNTYIGLFYTVDDKNWDPKKYIRGVLPKHKRHPWVVIYRPQVPHLPQDFQTQKKCDLLIWDPFADRRFRNSHLPTLTELPYMQRRLCDWVKEHTGAKNPNSTLDRVYYGGFNSPTGSHPLDLTIKFLEAMLHDPRNIIPSAQQYLLKHDWVILETGPTISPISFPPPPPTSPPPPPPSLPPRPPLAPLITTLPPRPPPPTLSKSLTTEIDDISDTEPSYTAEELREPGLKFVFHPPRGRQFNPRGGDSKCQNLLFAKVQKVLGLKAQAKEMRFDYTSTQEWYKDQVDEGRGYSHIIVSDWETIEKDLLHEMD